MIFHENRLLADDSHVISYLIFVKKLGKVSQNLSSAAVVIGALKVKYQTTKQGPLTEPTQNSGSSNKHQPGLPRSGKKFWKMKNFPGQVKVRELHFQSGKFKKK